MKRYVYSFGGGKADGNGKMKEILGGKGAGLAEMTTAGVPVPPGFTVSTEVCNIYFENNQHVPDEIEQQFDKALAKLEKTFGKKLGDPKNPLLLSVRSGARFSMPGMMNTILNLGMNDETVAGLAAKTGNEWFAYDCYRRFLQMFGEVAMDIHMEKFDHVFDAQKAKRKTKLDTDLTAQDLKDIVEAYKKIYVKETGKPFPQDALTQLKQARNAVFRSWWNDKAAYYRKMEKIPDSIGTAANVQAMVFGNMGNTSATGVGFTRDPGNGDKIFYGEFLVNAQGEDVVAGIRTPEPIMDLRKIMPDVFTQLFDTTQMLEKHYKDMQDFEFTVEGGRLWLLQSRAGKRTPQAAARIALDLLEAGLIGRAEALQRTAGLDADALAVAELADADGDRPAPLALAQSACSGVASGEIALDEIRARERAAAGAAVLLLRRDAETADIGSLEVAAGLLTARGARTSHAAVVARQLGRVCLVGCDTLDIDPASRSVRLGQRLLREGDVLTLDGHRGEVHAGALRVRRRADEALLARLRVLRSPA